MKGVLVNFKRLEREVEAARKSSIDCPAPEEVQVDLANVLNAIVSYCETSDPKPEIKESLLMACRFANNRLKHDKRIAVVGCKKGGSPFPLAFPYVSVPKDVYWRYLGNLGPEENIGLYKKKLFCRQKAAYEAEFSGRPVLGTLERVLKELAISPADAG